MLGLCLIPLLVFCLPDTHNLPKIVTARLNPLNSIDLLIRNHALREGVLLRLLLIAPYLGYDMV